jgi:iron complex transport system substrate-binding protein
MAPIKFIPQRIISLTPSMTEILFALESADRVVGVTDSCDYPAQVKNRPDVGCWFDPDLDKILALKPDLVLGLHSAHLELKSRLESRSIPVLLVNPVTVDETISDIGRIGQILGSQEVSKNIVEPLYARLSKINARVRTIDHERRLSACRILDLEDDCLHVAGPLSFQYDIIARAGGRNVSTAIQEAYPRITFARLLEWNPQVIFNCGFDISSAPAFVDQPEWKLLRAVQSGKVFTFDCGLTCRTGPRIADMVELLFATFYEDTKQT